MFSFPWKKQKVKENDGSRGTSVTENAHVSGEDVAIRELMHARTSPKENQFSDQFLGVKREPAFSLKFKQMVSPRIGDKKILKSTIS